MTEREGCALLKAKFEAAGYEIAENVPFDEDGVSFEIDGWDADKRVGYEYVTEEAGDGWDVDERVRKALAARKDLHVLIVDETDEKTLAAAADTFLAGIAPKSPKPKKAPARKKPATTKAPAKRSKRA